MCDVSLFVIKKRHLQNPFSRYIQVTLFEVRGTRLVMIFPTIFISGLFCDTLQCHLLDLIDFCPIKEQNKTKQKKLP